MIDLDAPSGASIRVRVPHGIDLYDEEAVLAYLDRQNARRVGAVLAAFVILSLILVSV